MTETTYIEQVQVGEFWTKIDTARNEVDVYEIRGITPTRFDPDRSGLSGDLDTPTYTHRIPALNLTTGEPELIRHWTLRNAVKVSEAEAQAIVEIMRHANKVAVAKVSATIGRRTSPFAD